MYDVIIVGAGSAGAPLAARLSEDPGRRVLLLEAGRDWRTSDAPAALRSANIIPFMHDPAHQAAWQWPGLMARRTAAQHPKFYWRGKALGGSSTVNAQIAIRGVDEAFDTWAKLGCTGWSAEDVLPIFDAIEDDPDTGLAEGIRRGGPLPVYRAPFSAWGRVDLALRDAALSQGYPWSADVNARDGAGVACNPINSRDGIRVSTNDAYLDPIRARANLEIRTQALVDRVVFTAEGRACGVRVQLAGADWTDIEGREIVLCAGAVHTPAILMRSGIGPAAQLRGFDIPVRHDAPGVGQNLMDHPILRANLALHAAHRAQGADARHTNCCVTYTSGSGGRRDMILVAYNHRGFVDAMPAAEGAVGVALYDVYSRGAVRLAGPAPAQNPIVEENMLSDPRDRLRLRDGVRRLARLLSDPAFATLAQADRFHDTDMTTAAAAALPDDDLDRLMLDQAADIQHAAGTCRMSGAHDPAGVVDPDLRVRGVSGLRVADASIMPTDCRANLHFTCVMIGEALARRMRAAQ